jgi:hypothetical protein
MQVKLNAIKTAESFFIAAPTWDLDCPLAKIVSRRPVPDRADLRYKLAGHFLRFSRQGCGESFLKYTQDHMIRYHSTTLVCA